LSTRRTTLDRKATWLPWGDHPIVVGVFLVCAIAALVISLIQMRRSPENQISGLAPKSETAFIPLNGAPQFVIPSDFARVLSQDFKPDSATVVQDGIARTGDERAIISARHRDVGCVKGNDTKTLALFSSSAELSGEFVVTASLDYTWGWSEIGVASVDQFDSDGRIKSVETLRLIAAGVNSSNNVRRIWQATADKRYQEARSWAGDGALASARIRREADGRISVMFDAEHGAYVTRLTGPVRVVASNQCNPNGQLTAVHGLEIFTPVRAKSND
jgi:hypothetical protein